MFSMQGQAVGVYLLLLQVTVWHAANRAFPIDFPSQTRVAMSSPGHWWEVGACRVACRLGGTWGFVSGSWGSSWDP